MNYYEPLLRESYAPTCFILLSGIIGLIYAGMQYLQLRKVRLYRPAEQLLNCDSDTSMQEVRRVYNAIRDGANAFLWAEYKYMFIFIVLFDVLIVLLVGSAGNCGAAQIVNHKLTFSAGPCWVRGAFTAVSFTVGGLTSMLAGFIGMYRNL